ncbi:hypothetical protein ACK8P5_26095 (plasmid) [Paenibacillus sp. EC2-1]|uniref:hypothetical protein n=1 Tax=Paenibacillus sp. EC2-1 TaxID=3388665 RepID=UPI003BEF3311
MSNSKDRAIASDDTKQDVLGLGVNTDGDEFHAVVEKDPNYPGIATMINRSLGTLVEACDYKAMIRVYSKDNESPISVNWLTGEINIPEDWQISTIK